MYTLKQKLKNGNFCAGTWIQIDSAESAEIAVRQGFDWVAVDLEHTCIENGSVSKIIRAIKKSNSAPLVRVASSALMDIRKPLDLGAEGIIVPLIETAEQARAVVAFAKYPPVGKRGVAFCAANNWGEDFDSYIKRFNDEVLIIVMIESRQGVENIDEILDVDGVDGVFVGPYDMSCSYGIPGEVDSPVIKRGLETVLNACIKKGKVAGQHIVIATKENVRAAIESGFTFVALGIDSVFLRQGMREVLDFVADANCKT